MVVGLIPAHTGKMSSPCHARPVSPAHPRSCGENASRLCPLIVARGSSPLTRGKPLSRSVNWVRVGLIPAHAGKTTSNKTGSRSFGAHPRSRGENHRMKSVAASLMGSSPLTRGKPHRHHLRARRPGLIPAHAGKTTTPGEKPALSRAHPRSRGENRIRGWPVS